MGTMNRSEVIFARLRSGKCRDVDEDDGDRIQ